MGKGRKFYPIYLKESPTHDIALTTLNHQKYCAIRFVSEPKLPEQVTPDMYVAGDILYLYFVHKGEEVGHLVQAVAKQSGYDGITTLIFKLLPSKRAKVKKKK